MCLVDGASGTDGGTSVDYCDAVHGYSFKHCVYYYIFTTHYESGVIGICGIGDDYTAADNFPFLEALAVRDSSGFQRNVFALVGLLDSLATYISCTAVNINGVGGDYGDELDGRTAGTGTLVGRGFFCAVCLVLNPVVTQRGNDQSLCYHLHAGIAVLSAGLPCCGAGRILFIMVVIIENGAGMILSHLGHIAFPNELSAVPAVTVALVTVSTAGREDFPYPVELIRVYIFTLTRDDSLAGRAEKIAFAALGSTVTGNIIIPFAVGFALIGSPADGFLPSGRNHFLFI